LRSLYAVLGLRSRAHSDEIKAAFRKLAKQYHPDLHPGDRRAEERFKEINEAHAILSDADARARYDASLSQKGLLRRRRVRKAAWTMATSFSVTVTLILTVMVWLQQGRELSSLFLPGWWTHPQATVASQYSERETAPVEGQRAVALVGMTRTAETASVLPQSSVNGALVDSLSLDLRQEAPSRQESESGIRLEDPDSPVTSQGSWSVRRELSLSTGERREQAFEFKAPTAEDHEEKTRAGPPNPVRTNGINWASYRDAHFGFIVKYPAMIFVVEPAKSEEHVKWFRSRDGRAVLRIFGTPNLAGRTLVQYRAALIQEHYAKATLDYAPQRNTWFVVSGLSGDDIFYERVTFACDGRSFHGWMLVFPASERLLYEPIIEEMHRNYRHSNGPRARCGAVKARVMQ
jgi:curved DNA-binding protein CbpA